MPNSDILDISAPTISRDFEAEALLNDRITAALEAGIDDVPTAYLLDLAA